MAITKKDIEKLSEVFATKKDLGGFATKKDLEGFATKKDLEGFATKKDLEGFATKKDMEAFATKKDMESLRIELTQKIQSSHNELSEKILASRDDILSFKDEIIKKLDDQRLDKLVLIAQNRRQDDAITNHEERIVRLEHKVLA